MPMPNPPAGGGSPYNAPRRSSKFPYITILAVLIVIGASLAALFYFSGASEIECDKQGRILIPKYLKDYAGIKKDVIVVGVSSRIEIWSKDAWQSYYNSSKESFEEIAEKLMTQEE